MDIIFLLFLLVVLFLIREPLVGLIWKKNADLSDLNPVWEKKRADREKEEKKRKKEYQTNYNKLKTIKNLKTILKVGISKKDLKGKPDHKIEKVSRGKKREELFYGGYKNRLGKFSYTFRVVIIDGKVDGWNDIKN
jgi:hypothetical protein